MVVLLMNETLTAKIKETGDLIHELGDFTDYDKIGEFDDLGLSNDEIIAVAIELLELTILSTFDEIDDAITKRTEKIKESITAMIGDADKTAAFIDLTLKKMRDDGVANGR